MRCLNPKKISKSFKRLLIGLWIILCGYALVEAIRFKSLKTLLIIPVPLLVGFGVWIASYLFVIFHELGHAVIGLALGFKITGIEVGAFPFKVLKIKRFSLRIGKSPGLGKTILGATSQSYSRWRHVCFLFGGIFLELAFFIFLVYLVRNSFWLKMLAFVYLFDTLWVNFFPKVQEGKPHNDGALLLEILFPKRAFKI